MYLHSKNAEWSDTKGERGVYLQAGGRSKEGGLEYYVDNENERPKQIVKKAIRNSRAGRLNVYSIKRLRK